MKTRLLLLGVVLAAGCAHHERKEVVWPDPPDKPRIKFNTAFRTTQDLDLSAWRRFARALAGGSRDPSLAQPMGLAISDDGQRIYVADFNDAHVLVADLQKKTVSLFAPNEPMGKTFNVALDESENVYVSDSDGHRILVYDRKGKPLRTIGEHELERPTGLAIDRKRGVLYVADSAHKKSMNHRVRAFALDGTFKFDLGARAGADRAPTKGHGDGQFYFPSYVAVDGDGDVYVADTMNFRVQEFGPDGRFIRKFGQGGDGPGAFQRVKGMAFDSFGNLYVVDGGHGVVQMFNKNLDELMFFGGHNDKLEYFDVPSCIAIDPRINRIYVCNEFVARVNVYDLINTTAADCESPPKSVADSK